MIYHELEEAVQDPEGAWGWLSKKRDDLHSSGRCLTNREMFGYFTKSKFVVEYRQFSLIRTRFYTVGFTKDLEDLTWGPFQKKFPDRLNIFEKMPTSDSKRKKLDLQKFLTGR